MIICEAENIYGIHRDTFQFKRSDRILLEGKYLSSFF